MQSIYSEIVKKYSKKDLFEYNKEDLEEERLDINDSEKEIEGVTKDLVKFSEWLLGQKVNRAIKYLVVHCTATPQDTKVSSIINYWRNGLGWKSPGYHIIIKPSGEYTILSDLNEVVNGVRGYNHSSINISYIGGVDDKGKPIDNRTDEQKRVMRYIVGRIKSKYQLEVKGHKDFPGVKKACPSFPIEEL